MLTSKPSERLSSFQETMPTTLFDFRLNRSQLARLSPMPPKITKLLLNVTIQGDFVALRVIMSSENTVSDLVEAALKQYVKEGRRPILPITDPSSFNLHYSQYSFDILKRDEKLIELKSRNFFLCPIRREERTCRNTGSDVSTSFSVLNFLIPWPH